MRNYLISILLSLTIVACASVTKSPIPSTARIHHVVICWLKDPGNTDHRRRIIEKTKTFRYLTGVLDINIGEVLQSPRPIVDDSFDIGIHITFARLQDLNNYLQHPVHRAAIKEVIQPLTRKITVYDFVER